MIVYLDRKSFVSYHPGTICIGEYAICGHNNEIPTFSQLLHELEFSGHIVTIKTVGCEVKIA